MSTTENYGSLIEFDLDQRTILSNRAGQVLAHLAMMFHRSTVTACVAEGQVFEASDAVNHIVLYCSEHGFTSCGATALDSPFKDESESVQRPRRAGVSGGVSMTNLLRTKRGVRHMLSWLGSTTLPLTDRGGVAHSHECGDQNLRQLFRRSFSWCLIHGLDF